MTDTNLSGPMDAITQYMPRGLMEWAPVLGAGTASGGAMLARMLAPAGSWIAMHADAAGVIMSTIVGAAVGVTQDKHAGVMVVLGGLAVGLPRVLESWMAKSHPVAGIGYYAAETANPLLGQVQASQINGLGYATSGQVPHAYGTVPGVAGAMAGPMQDRGMGAPVNLLGPATHHMALARHYGATHMG